MLDGRGGQAGLVAMLSARPLPMRFFQFAWLLTMPVRKDNKVLQRLGCCPTLWICPRLMFARYPSPKLGHDYTSGR
jgi:hypothetical protein